MRDNHQDTVVDSQPIHASTGDTQTNDRYTYQALLDQMPAGVMLLDSSGMIVYANECAATMIGYSIDELREGTWLSHSDNTATRAQFSRVRSEKSHGTDHVTRLVKKDGSTLWVSLSWRKLPGQDSNDLTQIVLTDITARKLAEEALRESEKRYRGLVESQEDLIVRCDSQNKFTFVNDAYCSTFGKSAGELIGSSFVPLVHKDDVPATLAAMELLKVPPYRCRVEQRAWAVDGWRWFSWEDCAILDEEGNIAEVQAIGRDITDSKAAHEVIEASEARLRTLVSNVPGAVYRTLLDHNWPMEFISEAIEDVSGYPASDFTCSHPRAYGSIIHPDDLMKVWKVITDSVQQRQQFVAEYRILHADGSIRWVMDRGQAVFSDEGDVLYLDGVILDITARKHAEEELQRACDIQREFLNNVTHEVRTPLTAVKGYVQMLLEGVAGPLSKEQTSLLQRVLVSSDHLLSIVTGVLEIARTKSGAMPLQPKVCSPCMIVDKAISAITPDTAKKGLRVNVQMPRSKPVGTYDEHKLTIILTNLLTNAVKFTESGGINIKVTCDRRSLEIIVVDTGMGIGEEHLPSIFDEFTQLHYPRKHKPTGFGIGLAIVATMIETIQGTLTVSSSPGVGTAFTLHIPTLDGVVG